MNRRSFFGTVFGGALAAVVAAWLPKTDAIAIDIEPIAAFWPAFETLHAGDIFTVDGRWVTNPVTGTVIVGMPQRFIVTSDVTANDPFVPYHPTLNQPDTAIDRRRERIL